MTDEFDDEVAIQLARVVVGRGENLRNDLAQVLLAEIDRLRDQLAELFETDEQP